MMNGLTPQRKMGTHRTIRVLAYSGMFVLCACTVADNEYSDYRAITGTETIRINFQPDTTQVPSGYIPDVGSSFGDRSDGLVYGWSSDISAWSPRERNSLRSPDKRHDTLLFMKQRSWELELPSGIYQIHVVVGDPNNADLRIQLSVEEEILIDDITRTDSPWLSNTRTIAVRDGRLTILDLSDGNDSRLNFIEVTPTDVGEGEIQTPSRDTMRINFQPEEEATPIGYVADSGAQFGDRSQGWVYGWISDISSWSPRVRNSNLSPDKLHDTFLSMVGRTWSVAVENGTYQVRIVAGDATTTDLRMHLQVEDQIDIVENTSVDKRWIDTTATVEVTDGAITIEDLSSEVHARLCFVEITVQNTGEGNEPKPVDPSSENEAPTAADDNVSTPQDTAVVVQVLANDTDPDGDSLRVASVDSAPSYGRTTVNTDGSITYTPDGGYTGADKFAYVVSDGQLSAHATVFVSVVGVSTQVKAIASTAHPNLYFNSIEISRIRDQIKSGTSAPARAAQDSFGQIKGVRAVGKPSHLHGDLNWHQVYKICQPLSKRNMEAAMSYLVEPTSGKADAMKSALLSWTRLDGTSGGENWANGSQRGGHMQYPLALMYDLLYNTGVLSAADKKQVDTFMQKYARLLTIKQYGSGTVGVDVNGNLLKDAENRILKLDSSNDFPRSVRIGYDNFYTLDITAGLVFAMVSHDQSLVDRIFDPAVAEDSFNINDSAFDLRDSKTGKRLHIRSFKNLIQGEIFPNGYTYDGYKRQYGFDTEIGFNGENKGDGQHYHFFALMGFIAAAEAAQHNGFQAWSYRENRLKRGFTTAAPFAHTAYRVADPGDRNHTPLYWTLLRRFPDDPIIKQVVERSEAKSKYAYFLSNVGPIWSLAGTP